MPLPTFPQYAQFGLRRVTANGKTCGYQVAGRLKMDGPVTELVTYPTKAAAVAFYDGLTFAAGASDPMGVRYRNWFDATTR